MIDNVHRADATPWLSANCYDMTIPAKPQLLAGVRETEARLPDGRMTRLARGLKSRLKAYRFVRAASDKSGPHDPLASSKAASGS